ncbi:MAG: alpha/beta fold hydrolase [Granulosicoccaceae bacterium]
MTAAIVALLGAIAPQWASAAELGLDFSRCSIGDGASLLPAQCAELIVPLDPTAPSGETLTLTIAKVPARTNKPKSDPFTLIAGGPGQSATESFPPVAQAFRHILLERDIYLIDQRGTGQSHKLVCKSDDASSLFEFDEALIAEQAKTCRESLPHDPHFFTTSVAVQDIELVRRALGIEQWNIYGVSYGTRVALHYLRRFPDQVRTLILDAVVAPEVALGPEIAVMAERALDAMFTRCENDSSCSSAFPELATKTNKLISSLKNEARPVQYEDLSSGQLRMLDFDHQHLAVTLRLMSYSAYGNAILPSMLFDASENNNLAPFARQAELQVRSLGDSIANGMHHAVVCTEDEPFTDIDEGRAQSADTYLGTDLIDALKISCEQWDSGVIDDDFKQPVESTVPTLLLSGSADPITPPEYAERAKAKLKNSKHIVIEHQGHMQSTSGCMPSIMAEFIKLGEVEQLDTNCLERLTAPPFFIDANGPKP